MSSGRLTLPMDLLFILDGFGSLRIHSWTGEPDCKSTFAILRAHISLRDMEKCKAHTISGTERLHL